MLIPARAGGRLWTVDNARFIKGEPGIGLEAADFLVKRNVMIVGSENWAVEVRQDPDNTLFLPVHGFLLNPNGVYLIETHLDPRSIGPRQGDRIRLHGPAAQAAWRDGIERGADRHTVADASVSLRVL